MMAYHLNFRCFQMSQIIRRYAKMVKKIHSFFLLPTVTCADPEASSTMQALSSAHYTDVRLYTLRIKIGSRITRLIKSDGHKIYS